MKTIITIFISLLSGLIYSQVYVSPNTYMYVDNQVLYVTQDVNLNAATSNIYLRNDAQLLQGTAGAGNNKGVGDLSVYQEGTVNNYQYNYWCSPVGNTLTSTTINNPFGVSQLKDVSTLTLSNNPVITTGYDGSSTPLTISDYWIWKFITSSTYGQWIYVGSTNTLNAGEGFTMKGTSGSGSAQRYDFRGKPNDGTISVGVLLNNTTLIGNPYPSAIDLNMFLLDASNSTIINGSAYFWEQVAVNSHYLNQYQGGYGTYTPATGYTPAAFKTYDGAGNVTGSIAGGTAYLRRFTPIGQGFMVRGIANGSVVMKNTFRVFVKEGAANSSQFAKGTNDDENFPVILNNAGTDYTQVKKGYVPQLKINAMFNDGGVRPTTLGFDDNTTDGFDYGFDGKSPSTESSEFYYIVDDNEYVANVVKFDVDKKIPLGFKCNQPTNFKIKIVDVLYGFDVNQEVYIHDKQTNLYHNIKDGVFSIDLPAGDDRSRFELTFKKFTLGGPDLVIDSKINIFQNNIIKNVIVRNPSQVNIISYCLYDIVGKMVYPKIRLGSNREYGISTASFSDGVYIVKLVTEDNVEITKRIIIKN